MNEEIYFDIKKKFTDFIILIKRDNCLGCDLDSMIEFNHTCCNALSYKEFISALNVLRKYESITDDYLKRLNDEFNF